MTKKQQQLKTDKQPTIGDSQGSSRHAAAQKYVCCSISHSVAHAQIADDSRKNFHSTNNKWINHHIIIY